MEQFLAIENQGCSVVRSNVPCGKWFPRRIWILRQGSRPESPMKGRRRRCGRRRRYRLIHPISPRFLSLSPCRVREDALPRRFCQGAARREDWPARSQDSGEGRVGGMLRWEALNGIEGGNILLGTG